MYRAFFPAFTSGNTDVGKLLFTLFYSRFLPGIRYMGCHDCYCHGGLSFLSGRIWPCETIGQGQQVASLPKQKVEKKLEVLKALVS